MKNKGAGSKPPSHAVDAEAPSKSNALVSTATLEALRNGDHTAFEEVFLRYYEKVKYFIFVLVKSSDLSEELTQDIFATLWEQRDKIDPNRNFSSYLYTMARNSVYNYAKSRNVRDRYTQAPDSSNNDSPADAEEIIIAKEMELLIEIAVARMPKQRRKIFEMSRSRGMSNEEIACELGVTRSAVDKQLRLALIDVKNIIAVFAAFAVVVN